MKVFRYILKQMIKLYYRLDPSLMIYSIPYDDTTDLHLIVEKFLPDKCIFGLKEISYTQQKKGENMGDIYHAGSTYLHFSKLIPIISFKKSN